MFQHIVFCAGYVRMEQLLILGIEPRISHLLGKCSNLEPPLSFYFLRQGLAKLSRETLDLCLPTSSSWPVEIIGLHH